MSKVWRSILVTRVGLIAVAMILGASSARATCTGDCGGDGEVTVDELIIGVNIALGDASPGDCAAMDSDGSGEVTIDELVVAVGGALDGCPLVVATPTATATPTQAEATPTPTCVADGSATLAATSAVPASGSGTLQVNCVTAENAGGTRTELTRVSARGTVNGLDFLLQVYFITATGEIDTVSYGWSPFPGIPGFFDNLAFCNTPGCSGVAVDLGSKTITLNNTALSDAGKSAVLNGTITLDSIPEPIATPTPPCPGGSADIVFTEVQGTNTSQPLPATLQLGTAMNFSQATVISALYDGCPMPFPRLTLGLQFSGAPIEAGAVFQVGSSNGNLNQIEFREEGFSNFKSWEAQSGTLIVDSVDNGQIAFRIVDARMRPRDIATRGTFVLNATATLR